MPARIPDDLLTPEQQLKRAYNKKHRSKKNKHEKIDIISQSSNKKVSKKGEKYLVSNSEKNEKSEKYLVLNSEKSEKYLVSNSEKSEKSLVSNSEKKYNKLKRAPVFLDMRNVIFNHSNKIVNSDNGSDFFSPIETNKISSIGETISQVSVEDNNNISHSNSNLIQFPRSNNDEKVADDLSQRLANLENLIEKLTGQNEKLQSAIISQREVDTEKQSQLNKISSENKDLRCELVTQTDLKLVWARKIKDLASPESFSLALESGLCGFTSIVKFLVVSTLIGLIVWLSIHISGDFFGDKGFEIAAGVLLGGGVLSFLARSAESVSRAIFFRGLAYAGTAAFLMVSYSGLNDKSLQENESYLASKKSIQSLEEQISGVSKIISALPPDFGKLREKEYARQDQIKIELDAEKQKLSTITPNSSADLAVVGNFIARFLLDVLVFALFEVLAGLFVNKRKLKMESI